MHLVSPTLTKLLDKLLKLRQVTYATSREQRDQLLSFCGEVVHDPILFQERHLGDRTHSMPLSVEHQRIATKLLTTLCGWLEVVVPTSGDAHMQILLLSTLTVASTDSVPGTAPLCERCHWVPLALSLLLLTTNAREATTALQNLICSAMEHLATQVGLGARCEVLIPHSDKSLAASSLRHPHNIGLLFHWQFAAAVMTQTDHRTVGQNTMRLARLCELFAWVPEDDSDRLGVVERVKALVSEKDTPTSIAPLLEHDLQRIAMRLLSLSLSTWSRRCIHVEGSGRFYSELGRLGAILPQLVIHGSPALITLACSLLNILSNDRGRMFDADPSVGEFFTVALRERLQEPLAEPSTSHSPRNWATHGVREWFVDQAIRNTSIATGHKLDGALATKTREVAQYVAQHATRINESSDVLLGSEACAIAIVRSLASASSDVHLLDSGFPILTRRVAMHYSCRLIESITAHTKPLQARALVLHWKCALRAVRSMFRYGGSHRMASVLLLLCQGDEIASSNPSGKLSTVERTLAQSAAQGNGASLLSQLVTLLNNVIAFAQAPNADGRHAFEILAHILLETSTTLCYAWNQSPRDLAERVIQHDVIALLFRGLHLLESLIHQSKEHDSKMEVHRAWRRCCHSVLETVEAMLTLHEDVRNITVSSTLSTSPTDVGKTIAHMLCCCYLHSVDQLPSNVLLQPAQQLVRMLGADMQRRCLQVLHDSIEDKCRARFDNANLDTLDILLVGAEAHSWYVLELQLEADVVGLRALLRKELQQRLLNRHPAPADIKSVSEHLGRYVDSNEWIVSIKTASRETFPNKGPLWMQCAVWHVNFINGPIESWRATGYKILLNWIDTLRRCTNAKDVFTDRDVTTIALVVELGDASDAQKSLDELVNAVVAFTDAEVALTCCYGLTKVVEQVSSTVGAQHSKRLLDYSLTLLKDAPSVHRRQEVVCLALQCTLKHWHAASQHEAFTDALNEWLEKAETATLLTKQLEDMYASKWSNVPFILATDVYGLYRLLSQQVKSFAESQRLWDAVTNRIGGMIADAVRHFLISVPEMTLDCVNYALPVLEMLALEATAGMAATDVAVFWIRIVQEGIMDRRTANDDADASTWGVSKLWLLRILSIILHASSPETAQALQQHPDAAANLSLLGFMLVDMIAVNMRRLDELVEGGPSIEGVAAAALSCADTLITVAWATLQPSSDGAPSASLLCLSSRNINEARDMLDKDDDVKMSLAHRSLLACLHDDRFQTSAVLPLLACTQTQELEIDVFYDRAIRSVLAALTVATKLWSDPVPAEWSITMRRVARFGVACLEQLSYIGEPYFVLVSQFLSEHANVESFLNHPNHQSTSAFNVDTVQPSSQRAKNAKELCSRMLQIASNTTLGMRWDVIMSQVVERVLYESAQLTSPVDSSIALKLTVADMHRVVGHGVPDDCIPPNCSNQSVLVLIDATVFMSELLSVVGAKEFRTMLEKMDELVCFVTLCDESIKDKGSAPPVAGKKKSAAPMAAAVPSKSRKVPIKPKRVLSSKALTLKPVTAAPAPIHPSMEPRAGRSKLYCLPRRQRGWSFSSSSMEHAVLLLSHRQMMDGERPPVVWASSIASSSPNENLLIDLFKQSAPTPQSVIQRDVRIERRRIIRECCQVGLTPMLLGCVLRHSAVLAQAIDSSVADVEEVLSGCFQYSAYFDHRQLAISLKAQECPLSTHLTIVMQRMQLSGTVRYSRRGEDARSLLLLLLACQSMPLAQLASCVDRNNLGKYGYLRLDRYGAADDRDSFDDTSDYSDITPSNFTSPTATVPDDKDSYMSRDEEEESSSDNPEDTMSDSSSDRPDAIFRLRSMGTFDTLSSMGDDEDEEASEASANDEQPSNNKQEGSSDDVEAYVQCVQEILSRSAPVGGSWSESAVILLYRVRPELPLTILQSVVPFGENGRWLRYYGVPILTLPYLVDVRSWCDATCTPQCEGSLCVARSHLIRSVMPLLLARSKISQRLLLYLVGLLCDGSDALVMSVIKEIIESVSTIPHVRLIALRLVYTIVGSRKRLSLAGPATSLDKVHPHDLRKVSFFQLLLQFLTGPTMTVLSQRMITYIVSSTYSADESDDDEEDEEVEERGNTHRPTAGEDGGANDNNDEEWENVDEDGNPEDDGDNDFELSSGDSDPYGYGYDRIRHMMPLMRPVIEPTLTGSSPLRCKVTLPEAHKASSDGEPHPHPLVWTNTWEIEGYSDGYNCDLCQRTRKGPSYHCDECKYDQCSQCVAQFITQRPLNNDDFDVGGAPYYEPTDDYEAEERHKASSNVFAHDQFVRLCSVAPPTLVPASPRPWEILMDVLKEPNCVDGCTEFLVEAISVFLNAAVFPWHHPTQTKQPPFLPELQRAEVLRLVLPFIAKWTSAFLERRLKRVEEARKFVMASKDPIMTLDEARQAIFAMDSLHSEAQVGSQAILLLPTCVDMCSDQNDINVLDGIVQQAWDVLTGHYSLLTTVLKKLDDQYTTQEFYGTTTMSQGSITLLVVMGKYYRAVNWRNAYVAAASKAFEKRLHQVPLRSLTSTAVPTDGAGMLRRSSTVVSENELYGLEESLLQRASSSAQLLPATTSEIVNNMKKSELVLEVLARRRGKKPTPTSAVVPSRPGTAQPGGAAAAASKEAKAETEDPWNEQRSEEIASIVGFAKNYRTALNFLIGSRNDPGTTLDDGVDFLLNTSKILDLEIRLGAFRAKMAHLHEYAGDQVDIAINRSSLLVSTFREMASFQVDLTAAAQERVTALQTQIDVVFNDEEAMDAGGVKREWLSLVFQRIIQLTDQFSTTEGGGDGGGSLEPPTMPLYDHLDDWFPPLFVRTGVDSTAFELNAVVDPSDELISLAQAAGILLGIAVSYDIPIDMHLTRAMYSHMIGRQPNMKDLEATDPSLYKNLRVITELETEDDMEALCLVFTAPCCRSSDGAMTSEIALVPDGANINVTLQNRGDYIRRRAEYRMSQQSYSLMVPFLEGFHLAMPIGFLQCFTAEDLELVCCGVSFVDTEDLRANTHYDGYNMNSPQVRWFWECCATLSQQDLVKLVQFSTASTRPPAGGFAALQPPLTLVRCPMSDNLPVAHTCMNRIDLPEYASANVLRDKLNQALALGSVGFGLV